MNLTRLTSTVGAAAVAGIAAWSSWSHMVGVALAVGERSNVAYVMPLSVDGLLVVASAAMVDDKRAGLRPRLSARIAFAVGVAASLGANVAHAHPTIGARMVAAWPAVALLLVVELLSRRGKRTAVISPESGPITAAILPASAEVASEMPAAKPRARKSAPKAAKVAEVIASRPDLSTSEAAKLAGVSPRTARRAINGHAVPDLVEASS